jgi:hypothetical protein
MQSFSYILGYLVYSILGLASLKFDAAIADLDQHSAEYEELASANLALPAVSGYGLAKAL